jgi:hypothetical protein
MGSRGFNLMIKRPTPLRAKPFERYEGANLYRAFRNSSLDNFDALGLGVNCGSGATSGLVPDKPGGYDFNDACKNHDKCYCTSGSSKDDCDAQFLEDMQAACESSPLNSVGCNDLAQIYYGAVHNYGQDAFDKAQKAGCPPPPCPPTAPPPSNPKPPVKGIK